MTIEDTLAAILAELRTLNARMAHIGGAVAENPTPASAPAPSATPASPARSSRSKQQTADAPKPADPPSPPVSPASTAAVTYDQVKAAGLALMGKKGREGVAKVFAQFKINSAQEAKPETYPALLSALVEAAK